MNFEEFKKQCEDDDYNVVDRWDIDHFKIVCSKFDSGDVITFFREVSGQMGSEYTGYMRAFNHDSGMIVKCKCCGNAMNIGLPS